MDGLVTVFGGSGFVGRYITEELARLGWRIRVAVRRPNEAGFVRTYGAVGQVEPVFCNIRDDASVEAVMRGADAVVNCVGILAETGRQSFEAVQSDGAERIAKIAQKHGVERFVQLSAIGADEGADSEYARTKAAGEKAVLEHMPQAVILRPSIVFGPEDQFFNRFAGMARLGPVLPVVGAETRFQPVYVEDVAKAAAKAIEGEVKPGIYELGGPDVQTFRELMGEMLEIIRRRRLVANIPFGIGHLMGWGFGLAEKLSFGIVKAPITRDQVRNLAQDNVVSEGAMGFAELGIEPTAMEAVLPEYLWRFRPSGQYDEIKESARNLR
ncbi:complex I NDUFA9 subunit family protein [Aestuariibius sp. 2305UL40-4]|uniref:complex I NDUFA9 subunit family protein n=1 Tax=Aestuariibius violaceus TaxID=3234132 RepID=UPI00345E2D5E